MRRRFSIWRIFSWVSWAAFWLTLGADLLRSLQQGVYVTYAGYDIIKAMDPASLPAAQAWVGKYLLPVVWDPLTLFVLQSPLIIVLGIPALILSVVARLRRRKSYRYGGSALSS